MGNHTAAWETCSVQSFRRRRSKLVKIQLSLEHRYAGYILLYQEYECFEREEKKQNKKKKRIVHRSVNKLFYFNALMFVSLHNAYHEVCLYEWILQVARKKRHVSWRDFLFLFYLKHLHVNISYKRSPVSILPYQSSHFISNSYMTATAVETILSVAYKNITIAICCNSMRSLNTVQLV